MKILSHDKKQGSFALQTHSLDDLWLISQVLSPGGLVRGKTTRKIKISETKVEKKTYTVSLRVKSTAFEHDALHILGTIESEHDDIPKGSHQSLHVHAGDQLTIIQDWLSYHIKKIEESTSPRQQILLVIHDREEAHIARLVPGGYEIISSFKGEAQKKDPTFASAPSSKKSFYAQLEEVLLEYTSRYDPFRIVVASPAFFKEDFLKSCKNQDLPKKCILATVSAVDRTIFRELIKRPEVTTALQLDRAHQDLELVEKIFEELSRGGKVAYGPGEVAQKAEEGSILDLFVSSAYYDKQKEEETYEELFKVLKLVEDCKGTLHIISSELEAGKKLDALSGIAAILRY